MKYRERYAGGIKYKDGTFIARSGSAALSLFDTEGGTLAVAGHTVSLTEHDVKSLLSAMGWYFEAEKHHYFEATDD